jgi:alcohol dehydrogenase class IV
MTFFGVMRLPRSVLFGSGQRRAIGTIAAQIGERAFICTDTRFGSDPELRNIVSNLAECGVATEIFDQTPPEVPMESISGCLKQAAAFSPRLVIGIGGGSCMDMAKVVALLLAHGGDVRDYYGELKVPGPTLPLIAVPTTAGTGSEVTPVAVIGDTERNLKVGIVSPYLIAHTAVCDPELTLACPPALTATCGADALTHAIEAFTAGPRKASPELPVQNVFVGKNALSDHFALLAISSIWTSLYRAYRDGSDMEARERMMLGALAAGCAFGVAGTATAHALQYPIGALTHTPHGLGVATLLPYVMEFNRPSCVKAVADIARTIQVGDSNRSEEELSYLAVDAVASLLQSVGIPRTLADLGLPADQQAWTAERGFSVTRLVKNNPRELDLHAMQAITKAAFSGDRTSLRHA